MPRHSTPTSDAHAQLRRESFCLALSLTAIPALCGLAGLANGTNLGTGSLAVTAVLIGYAGLVSRACRRGYHAAVAGDLHALAHHVAYPAGLLTCLITYDDMIARPFALGYAFACQVAQTPA